MSDSGGVPERVVGKRAPVSVRQQRIQTVALAAYALFSVWLATRGRWTIVALYATLAALSPIIQRRRPTVVDASGIRRPFPRRRVVPWSEVTSVEQAQPWATGLRLHLKSGKTMTLVDISAADAPVVAALGRVALTAPPRVPLPPPRLSPRTQRDVEADVDRRAEALAERGRQLDAEYRRIQGRNRPAGAQDDTASP